MAFQIRGTLHRISEAQQVTERFRKREFVLETRANPRYPQYVSLELHGEDCKDLDNVHEGDEVGIEFDVNGRKWTSPEGQTKYFNTLKAWSVTVLKSEQAPDQPEPPDMVPF